MAEIDRNRAVELLRCDLVELVALALAALLTSTAAGPSAARISPSAARSAAVSVRSQGTKSGRAAHSPSESASSAPVSRCRSRNATLAPFSTKARTKHAPMPLAPPVMITVRPSSDLYRVKLIGSPRLLRSTKRDDLGRLSA